MLDRKTYNSSDTPPYIWTGYICLNDSGGGIAISVDLISRVFNRLFNRAQINYLTVSNVKTGEFDSPFATKHYAFLISIFFVWHRFNTIYVIYRTLDYNEAVFCRTNSFPFVEKCHDFKYVNRWWLNRTTADNVEKTISCQFSSTSRVFDSYAR